eukprot:TRINITY_DN64798_c0_g1_i1.p1 TRINITY_DN64798_c0_g1~~TRINITY_DN64798_c0_g1_i1.p1  ORF type:complete len:287 (+),score=128.17 TRINITY_DN64798_c0_g1_i1:87-863(+)
MAGNCLRTASNDIVTTEWEDVQYKFGNKVGKYATQEEEIKQQKLMKSLVDDIIENYDPLEHRTAEELDQMLEEDGRADDDEDAVIRYRRQRRQEMLEQQRGQRHGSVRHITKPEYVNEVSKAGEGVWVVVVLVEEGHEQSDALRRACTEAAERNPTVKFVTIRSTDAIENFPRKHLPTVLLYINGEMRKQIVGSEAWGGLHPSAEQVEGALRRFGPLADTRAAHKEESDDSEEEERERAPAASGPARRGGGRSKFSIV